MDDKQKLTQLYVELCDKLSAKVPEIKWMDLWRNQVDFFSTELTFAAPAAFFSFDTLGHKDLGNKVQQVKMQVSIRYYFETLAKTYKGSYNQDKALEFLDSISKIHGALHGTSGTNYSEMMRTGLRALDSAGHGSLYLQTFTCDMYDYAASDEYEATDITIQVEKGGMPETEEDEPNDGTNTFVI